MGVSEIRENLVGVLLMRETYYLGDYIGDPVFSYIPS